MTLPILVINPNASQSVTDGIAEGLKPLNNLHPIQCMTLREGPPGIESQLQADLVIPHILKAAQASTAAAYVIACFGDPGLHALRDLTNKPVVGIQEAAISMALTLGQRIGIIAILPASVPRHLRNFGAMGIRDRIVGDRALNLGVTELNDGNTLEKLVDTGRMLRDLDGADAIILGCAGMARHRLDLEAALGLPVIDPCQAGAALAISRVHLNQLQNPKVSDA